MTFKKYDTSKIKTFLNHIKVQLLGYILGFSVFMMISHFNLSYSFFAGIILSIIFYGISKAPDL